MSKLKVKSSKRKLKKPLIENIQLSLSKGVKINHERCLLQPEVDNCNCLEEQGEHTSKFYVCKILYPRENVKKYQVCDHANDFTPNRDEWTHKKYNEYLSTPKKNRAPSSMPRWIRKNISPATVRVQKLAQPRKNALLDTFNKHSKHLSMIKIETLVTRIHDGNFQTPQQALSEMKQKLREKQNKIKRQKCDIRSLQKKIRKCNEFNNLAENLTKTFREFMTKDRRVDVDACDESEILSRFVHNRLSHMFKSPRADKNTSDIADSVLLDFSNKIASCMCDILKNTGHHRLQAQDETSDDCVEQLKKLCIPIEDFYPPEILVKQEEEEEEEEASDQETDYESDLETTSSGMHVTFEDKKMDEMSFLKPSQINLTAADCEKLQTELKQIETALNAGTIKRSASAKSAKASANVNDDNISTKSKKKKSKKKKKTKKVNLKCFGNINIKPQWAVEWNSKNRNNVEDES